MAKNIFTIKQDDYSYDYWYKDKVFIQFDMINFDTYSQVGYSLPLDDVTDACKALGYKGIIDIIYISCDLYVSVAFEEVLEALKTLQNEFKDFIIITSKRNTPYLEQREEDDITEEVIDLGPFKCIDNNPYFRPHPYAEWIRFVYCDNNVFANKIGFTSYIYRINAEIVIVTKTISCISSANPCSELLNHYKEYLKSLEEMRI